MIWPDFPKSLGVWMTQGNHPNEPGIWYAFGENYIACFSEHLPLPYPPKPDILRVKRDSAQDAHVSDCKVCQAYFGHDHQSQLIAVGDRSSGPEQREGVAS